MYNLKALQAVKLFSDNLEGMLIEWDAALLDAEDVHVPMHFLEATFLGVIEDSPRMLDDVKLWRRAEIGDKERSYDFLYKAVRSVVLKDHQAALRRAQLMSRKPQTKGYHPALAATEEEGGVACPVDNSDKRPGGANAQRPTTGALPWRRPPPTQSSTGCRYFHRKGNGQRCF